MHITDDRWRWRSAVGTDTPDIVAMAQGYFGVETKDIYVNDPIEYSRNVTLAIVNQFYNPRAELVSVARDVETGKLLAYTWAVRNERAPWSPEEMVVIRIAHVDMDMTGKERIHLCAQMIRMWEKWALACEVKIICSSTIRSDQPAFLKLHERAGYIVRGSIAYKRLSKIAVDIDDTGIAPMDNTTTGYNPEDYSDPSITERNKTKEQ